MSNLDQFFKDKFQDRDFEFQEEYWDQARDLIQADQKRRRRSFWMPWFFGLLLLGAVGLFVFVGGEREGGSESQSQNQSQAQVRSEDLERDEVQNQTQMQAQAPSQAQNQNQKQIQGQAQNGIQKINEASGKNQILGQVEEDRVGERGVSSLLERGDISKSDVEVLVSEENIAVGEKVMKGGGQDQVEGLEPIQEGSVGEGKGNDLVVDNKEEEFALLLFSVLPIAEIDPLVDPIENNNIPVDIDLPKDKKWTLGISVAGQIYPAKSDEDWWIGATVGPSLRYRLGRNVSVQSDLLYRYRRGQFGEIGTLSQKEYSFGLQEKSFHLATTSLHYLEWPIYVQWKNGRQYVEGGLSINYLLGARGELVQNTSRLPWERAGQGGASGPKIKTEILEKGTLETTAFRKLNAAFLLGYRYDLSKGLTANFLVSYDWQAMVKEDNEPTATPVLKEAGPLHFSIGLTYFPFK